MASGDSHNGTNFRTRRDSNTSTLSSCFSSLRSDNSPNPFGSLASSRRSSEVSTNRLSITNSPYEYDITGNRPYHARRSCNSDSSANMSHMEAQFQKTNLGSQTCIPQVQPMNSMNMCSPSSRYQQERIARFLAARQDIGSARNSSTSNPTRTPQPNDLRNGDARRASDPVRAMDQNYSPSAKQIQRFHSLNMGKPLPVPPQGMRSLRQKSGSFNSSRSSIATDPETEFDLLDTDNEAGLEEKMLEDSEDMIIPDDMRRFLNERYGDNHSLYSYDPNALTESEIFYLQQGGQLNGANMSGNVNNMNNSQSHVPIGFNQSSHNGSNASCAGGQLSGNNSMQNFGNYCGNSNIQQQGSATNCVNADLDNQSVGVRNDCDPLSMQQQLSRENTAAWVQRQNTENLPQSPSLFPPLGSPRENISHPASGNLASHPVRKDGPMNQGSWMGGAGNTGTMNPNMHLDNMSNNMNNGMHPMMQSPVPSTTPIPRPPSTPKSNHGINHSHHKIHHQIHLNPAPGAMGLAGNHMGVNMPHAPVSKIERSSPQVQVPHISQSQIPPRAKAASRNQLLQQQQQQPQQHNHQQQHQQQHQQMSPAQHQQTLPLQQQQQQQQQHHMQQQQHHHHLQQQQQMNNMYNMNMMGNFQNKMMGAYGPMTMQQYQFYQQQQQQQQQHFMNMNQNQPNQPNPLNHVPFNGPMNAMGFNPDCQQSTREQQQQQLSKLEMSPGCNQVTSSTDIVQRRQEPEAPPIENFMDNLNSISAENFMDNINSISQENMNMYTSPSAMSNRSNSQASRYSAALMNTSNMVVNDMSSTMMQLAEENKFFTRRH